MSRTPVAMWVLAVLLMLAGVAQAAPRETDVGVREVQYDAGGTYCLSIDLAASSVSEQSHVTYAALELTTSLAAGLEAELWVVADLDSKPWSAANVANGEGPFAVWVADGRAGEVQRWDVTDLLRSPGTHKLVVRILDPEKGDDATFRKSMVTRSQLIRHVSGGGH